jgi:hypothetical protein
MKKQMYSLLDHTAQVFLNPLSFINDGDAIRWFGTVVNNKEEQTNISKHPEQFTLYRLADYDDKLGIYSPADEEKEKIAGRITNMNPKQIITGIQVQEEETKTYTVKDLIAMLKYELQSENVIDISDQKEG